MPASLGGGGGANVLKAAKDSAGFFGADIRGSLSVGKFGENFDRESSQLTNTELVASLREQLGMLLVD